MPLKFIRGLFASVAEATVFLHIEAGSSVLYGIITCNGPDGKLQA